MNTFFKKFILLVVVLSSVTAAYAYDFSADYNGTTMYFWITNTINKTCEVTYQYQEEDFGYSNYSGSVTIPSTVTYSSTTYKVTGIGMFAFNNCRSLTSITIPNSVTYIGESAFSNCSGLTFVTFPNSVTTIGREAFNACSGLTSITIPNSVTYIGEYAFCNCRGLTSITIGNSVTSIGNYAFCGCSVTSITIPSSVTSIGHYAFGGCSVTSVKIPNSVTYIGTNPFESCSNLSSIVVEEGNPNYDSRNNCNAIINSKTNELIAGCKNTVIPESVTSIGHEAFYGCSGLTSVTIPNSVTSIGYEAFESCNGLTSVTIGNSVTSIEYGAFMYCSGLTKVYCYAETIPSTESDVFYNIGKNPTLFVLPPFVNNYKNKTPWSSFSRIVPFGINEGLVYNIDNNTGTASVIEGYTKYSGDIVIPQSFTFNYDNNEYVVTSVGDGAFSDCSGLTSVTIPNTATSIKSSAFSGCSGLTEITIPSSVSSIGSNAFANCTGLLKVIINDVASWCGITFSSADANPLYYAMHLYLNQELLMDLVIPNTVSEIRNYAFYNASDLKSVKVPNSITNISSSAFIGCNGLKDVEINATSIGTWFSNYNFIQRIVLGNNVSNIGANAFSGCTSLNSVHISNSVTSIGNNAFSGCTSLSDITSEITDVFITGTNAFEGCENATLHVPAGTVAAYCSNADWKRIIHIVEKEMGYSMIMACNPKGSVLINDTKTFTNKIGEVEVNENEENTFVFTPAEGCELEQVTLNGLDVTSSVSNNKLVATISGKSQMNVIFSRKGSDVNNDGRIDINDVVLLVNIILGN